MGCGQPAGEAGLQHRPRRRRPGRAGRRPRRHRQPLLLVVAADDPHGRPRHQGRRGRRVHRRRRRDREPLRRRRRRHRRRNDAFADAGARTARARRGGGQEPWTPPTGLPDVYIAMGQTAENVAEFEKVSPRGDGRVRRAVPAPRRRQRRERLLRARDHPGHAARRHRGVARTTAPAPAPRSRGSPRSSRCSAPTAQVTAGNACPLNDGAAAVVVMSDTKAARARHHAAGPHRVAAA